MPLYRVTVVEEHVAILEAPNEDAARAEALDQQGRFQSSDVAVSDVERLTPAEVRRYRDGRGIPI